MRIRSLCLLLALACLFSSETGVRAEPKTFPQAARDRYEQGKALQKQGRDEEALKAFYEAQRLGMEDYPRLYLSKAISEERLGARLAAIDAYSKIIDGFGLEESCRY
jgi:tetratricopeptide (TPR) repeat protein